MRSVTAFTGEVGCSKTDVQVRSKLKYFSRDFPPALAAAAVVTGAEAAWRPAFAASAIEWLAAQEYAVVGMEL